jgi:hypothetical protein
MARVALPRTPLNYTRSCDSVLEPGIPLHRLSRHPSSLSRRCGHQDRSRFVHRSARTRCPTARIPRCTRTRHPAQCVPRVWCTRPAERRCRSVVHRSRLAAAAKSDGRGTWSRREAEGWDVSPARFEVRARVPRRVSQSVRPSGTFTVPSRHCGGVGTVNRSSTTRRGPALDSRTSSKEGIGAHES